MNPFARHGETYGHTPSRVDDADFRRLVEEAKARHDLSAVIGEYTTLKRRGRTELVGLCPFHQEKTPSFEVNDDKGLYHCHGCGAGGDAIRFLMTLKGMSFRNAYEALAGDRFPTVDPSERAKRRADSEAELAARIALARWIWDSGVNAAGTPAAVYAQSRGITGPLPGTVRFVCVPRWRNPETGEVGPDVPAMACALQNHAGELVGVQCVFLANGGRSKYQRTRRDGSKAKAKLTFGQAAGSAFWASGSPFFGDLPSNAPPTDAIICEGPEDGLTLAQCIPNVPVMVACGTDLMPRVHVPEPIRSVTLAGDNNAAGREAVASAAEVFTGQGLTVRALYPGEAYKDFNDELRGITA